MDLQAIQTSLPVNRDNIKNSLILYYRPTCPACIVCVPTFEKVPAALKDAGLSDVSIYMINTNGIDLKNAVGGEIITVPKIVYVNSNGTAFVYPKIDRTVEKIVQFVQKPSSLSGGLLGALGNLISDLFVSGLSGGAKRSIRLTKIKRSKRSRASRASRARGKRAKRSLSKKKSPSKKKSGKGY
jgi:hypothetical protein